MTEDEAKTKWCPMVRMQDLSNQDGEHCELVAHNRSEDMLMALSGYTCLASDCMMWRWVKVSGMPQGYFEYSETDGYCGLTK